jgi:hypothetical protein
MNRYFKLDRDLRNKSSLLDQVGRPRGAASWQRRAGVPLRAMERVRPVRGKFTTYEMAMLPHSRM